MIGSFARNFHEGTRSEYLALYFFSSLSTAVPVPHPEDTGTAMNKEVTTEQDQNAIHPEPET